MTAEELVEVLRTRVEVLETRLDQLEAQLRETRPVEQTRELFRQHQHETRERWRKQDTA
jgi:hypothetical protein